MDDQSKANEDTALALNTLAEKNDQLSGSFATVEADLQRWKNAEEEYNAENMEDDIPYVGNTTLLVPMSITPPASIAYFLFGETAEIQPDYRTASQTMPVSMTFPPSFTNPVARANAEYSDFNPSFFRIPTFGEAQGLTDTGIPIISDETGPRVPHDQMGGQSGEVPHSDENANVPSSNVTPTGQASLPPGAQKAKSEICDQYLR